MIFLMTFAFIPGLYKTKMMFRSSLFHLLLCCVTQTLGKHVCCHIQFIRLSAKLVQQDIFVFRVFTALLSDLLKFQYSQGVRIQSDPGVSSEGLIETKLKSSVTLLCLHDGSSDTQAEEELVWLRNGAVVSLKEENKKGRSSVCVTPVLHEDNGATFTCHLSRNATVRASVTLNVTCEFLQRNE